MNSREKFNSVMNFEKNTPILKAEFSYWGGTIRNWLSQGMPEVKKISEKIMDSESVRASTPLSTQYSEGADLNVRSYFDLDSYLEKFPSDLSPMAKPVLIEENDEHKIYIDKFKIKEKVLKKTPGIPMALEFPIKNRKDLYDYIEQYDDSDFSKRVPADFEDLAKELKNRDFPIRLGGNPFGFSFFARHLMGDTVYLLSLYDDPGLIKEFNSFFLKFVMKYWSYILDRIDVDCIFILEDCAYKTGSFISKEMFKEFMTPYYIELIDFLKSYNIKNIFVDCDGLIDELIPLWAEAGVKGIFPIEAVNDVTEIREKYPELCLMGGFNKKVLFKDSTKEKIDAELEKVKKIIALGGYIPHVDHAVSEDVTWENFKYYREKLNFICDNYWK